MRGRFVSRFNELALLACRLFVLYLLLQRAVIPASAVSSTNGVARDALHLLQADCFSCHNEEKKKGGLVLTSHAGLLKGNDDGPVVVAGKPEESRLAKALLPEADPHMPPKQQLTANEIRLLRDWIGLGAPWDAAALADEEPGPPVELAELPATYHPAAALALSPDGKRLAAARGGAVVVYDVSATNFPVLGRWQAHRDAVQALAWSPDGHRLVSGAFRRLAIWDGASFQLACELTTGLVGRVTAIKFAPDGARLAAADSVAGRAGYLRMVNPQDARLIDSWRVHSDTTFDLDFSRDGKQLVTAGGDRLIKVWDLATKKEVARLEGHASQVLAVAFNTNATQVVSGGVDKQLRVWDIATREKIVALGNHTAPINAVAWPGDGAAIVAVSDAGGVFAYRNLKAHTGEQSSASADERKLAETDEPALAVAATSDAQSVFVGTQDGAVQAFNGDGKRLAKLALEPPGTPSTGSGLSSPLATTSGAVDGLGPTSEPRPGPNGLSRALPGSGETGPALSLSNGPRLAGPLRTRPGTTDGFSRVPDSLSRRAWAPVQSLSVEPSALQLSTDSPRGACVITARLADGFEVDATDEARLSLSRPAPIEVRGPGEVRALEPGHGILTAHFGGKRVSIPVTVIEGRPAASGDTPGAPAVSFVRDVLPALSRAGCNAGACHAKPEGQNGFKLSVFCYDPRSDYAEIVRKARGRRVFPAAPDESLLLQKPLTALPHEGGLRFERGSETHRLLARWLREGMAYTLTNEPVVERISVFPKERRYHHGATQRLLVRAHYSDGSERDVTPLAAFADSDKEVARADENGVVRVGTLTGQGVVVARYMGFVADAQIIVPAEHLLPEEQYAALPRNNFIDELAYEHLQLLGLFPSDLCSDAEFLRRAKLDAVGRLPAPAEVRAFLADPSPEKRRRFIGQVLEDPSYADYWANKWADLLRPNPDRVGVKSVFTLDQWLRECFRQNKPYDQFVRDILLAEGTNHRDGPAVIYRDRREPAELTTMFSQLFLGTRLECAKCHHHPNEKWSQDDFYQFAAFFGSVKQKGAGLSPPISAGTETFYFAPGGAVKHPVSGMTMTPRPPDGPPVADGGTDDPRRALAAWLTAPDNPFFARAAVNRVWAAFFGRGLVEPVDDFRVSNPCVNPRLLTALADDFARHGYDLKHLIRVILESRLYQLSSAPVDSNLADTRNFSRAYRRRLPAEVLLDAVDDATGVPDTFAAMPVGARAVQTWSYKIQSHFLDAFGRPNSSSDCPCERDTHMSVVQSLHLMNARGLQAKLSDPAGRARQWADSDRSPAQIVSDIYLATLNRPPDDQELTVAVAAFAAKGATRRTATEDVFWALLNSAQFVFNH